MAASDPPYTPDHAPLGASDAPLSAAATGARLQEEILRAEREGTRLSCLLLVIENLEQMASEHGEELREQTVDYVAIALARELRRFDRVGRASAAQRHELLIILPGADGPRGEVVARRTLQRLRTIKVEAAGARLPLEVSVGLSQWSDGASAQQLLQRARSALGGNPAEQAQLDREPLSDTPVRRPARSEQPPRALDDELGTLGRAGGHW